MTLEELATGVSEALDAGRENFSMDIVKGKP